jgi:hypothetical protein
MQTVASCEAACGGGVDRLRRICPTPRFSRSPFVPIELPGQPERDRAKHHDTDDFHDHSPAGANSARRGDCTSHVAMQLHAGDNVMKWEPPHAGSVNDRQHAAAARGMTDTAHSQGPQLPWCSNAETVRQSPRSTVTGS